MTDNRLKSLADRIETLMDERDGIQSDIRDIYTEAKSAGYVPKVLRKAITRKRMDPDKRSEEDTILDLYEDALSPSMRRAVQMAKAGATSREIETETGIDHVTVTRSVSLNKKSETPKPEDGDDGITESCGGVESRHAGGISGVVTTGDTSSGRPSDVSTPRVDLGQTPAGVAPGPHDAPALEPPRSHQTPALERRESEANEAPATPSVGAVTAEPRVAPDDDLTIPPHLRGPSPANRRMGT